MLDGDFVGVVTEDASTAEQALSLIKAKWNVPAQISNQELFEHLRNHPDGEDTGPRRTGASVTQAMSAAEVKLEQHYTVQYIAHAPLEPRAAVAEWNGDKLTVWTGTQRPFGVRDDLVECFVSGDKGASHYARHG